MKGLFPPRCLAAPEHTRNPLKPMLRSVQLAQVISGLAQGSPSTPQHCPTQLWSELWSQLSSASAHKADAPGPSIGNYSWSEIFPAIPVQTNIEITTGQLLKCSLSTKKKLAEMVLVPEVTADNHNNLRDVSKSLVAPQIFVHILSFTCIVTLLINSPVSSSTLWMLLKNIWIQGSGQAGGIGGNPSLPHTTKRRITTNLKSINNQKRQKVKLHGTPTKN